MQPFSQQSSTGIGFCGPVGCHAYIKSAKNKVSVRGSFFEVPLLGFKVVGEVFTIVSVNL
jgi:hypothetical protein